MEATSHQQYFQVEGVRCARCIQAIESALHAEPAISHARVNMSTNRLSIRWQGTPDMAEKFAQKITELGYRTSPAHTPNATPKEERFLLRCMAISGFAMGNIMLISFALWGSEQQVMGTATRDVLHWISALIALPVIAYAGQPFFRSAWSVLKHRRTNMDVPISLALLLACGMSLHETIRHGEHAYFDSAVMLLFFLLIGRWLDARARGKARENAKDLLAMMHGNATVIEDAKQHSIPIRDLTHGMVIRIAVGEKIPTDARVLDGASEIDTSLVTGETVPRPVHTGDIVYGGTLNLHAPLLCRVEKASADSMLADIIQLMEQAEQSRARYVQLADKAAKLYTPVVHTLAASAFLGWLFIGGIAWQDALLIAITTLIITCPCALGLAVPVVQVLATSTLMKQGIMVKSGDALERLAAIDTIVLDKTGTLTQGTPRLIGEYPADMLQYAASLAAHSHHPYSRAITAKYTGDTVPLEQINEIAATGIVAHYQGRMLQLGKHPDAHYVSPQQHPEIWLSLDGEPTTCFILAEHIKEDARDIVAQCKAQHITPYLLSGDRAETTHSIAALTGIAHWNGGMLPADKTNNIAALQAQGHKVLMVGDGLNDAPSLAQANVSMSPATGMDITQNSADIVFRGALLAPIMVAWRVARKATQLVQQNFTLAVLYNCFAIPLAVAGYVTPLVAALAMSGSSLLVIANSFRIARSTKAE